ncbi:MAG: hypothetical protein WC389_18910 [Lutibacter sp.]|jgi:rubrerythrin
MRKKQWIHCSKTGVYTPLNITTTCGKEARRIHVTSKLNNVTCPRCIEKLKENYWHCPECGFIDDSHATNDEKCEVCGSVLNQEGMTE